MGKILSFVRLSPYADMRIKELVNMTGQNKSVVIRTLVDKGINDLTDTQGNWKFNEKGKERKGK